MKELAKLFLKNLAKVVVLFGVSAIVGVILYSAMQFLKSIFGFWIGMSIVGALVVVLAVTAFTAIDWKLLQSEEDEEAAEEAEETAEEAETESDSAEKTEE